MTYQADGPNYTAIIPAAMSEQDARNIAVADSGLMPWQISVKQVDALPEHAIPEW